MNDMFVGILGLAAIAATVISLTRSRMLPAMAFILWPSLPALVMAAGGRCSFADIEAMIKAGFDSTDQCLCKSKRSARRLYSQGIRVRKAEGRRQQHQHDLLLHDL